MAIEYIANPDPHEKFVKVASAPPPPPPTKRQVPEELDALWFAVDQCEKLVSLLESRLAPFCFDLACGSNPVSPEEGKPLCAAATRVREVRVAMEDVQERLRKLNVCLEI